MGREEESCQLHMHFVDFAERLKTLLRKPNSAGLAATITCSQRAAAAKTSRRTGSHYRAAPLCKSFFVFFSFYCYCPFDSWLSAEPEPHHRRTESFKRARITMTNLTAAVSLLQMLSRQTGVWIRGARHAGVHLHANERFQ